MKSFIEVHCSVQITSMNQNAKISVLPFDYIFMAWEFGSFLVVIGLCYRSLATFAILELFLTL